MLDSSRVRRRADGAGFTLIELLVVISIITLLVALLLPSLQQAHEQGQRIVCLANMRQQGVAFLSYANDWGEALPTVAGLPAFPDATYVGLSAQRNYWNSTSSILYSYTSASYKVWICPDFYAQDQANADQGGGYGLTLMCYYDLTSAGGTLVCTCHPNAGSFGWFGWPGNTYSWAEIDMATGTQAGPPGFGTYLVGINSMSRLKKPSTDSMEVEVFPCFGGQLGWDGRTFDPLGGNARHGGNSLTGAVGGNALYADGHARWSNLVGPYLPWECMCFTNPSDKSAGPEPYAP